jgi:hypothetical protein
VATIKTEPFDVGDEVTIFADFVNAAGAPANPTDAKLQIEKPDGTELTTIDDSVMANPSTGRLEYAYLIVAGGEHRFRFSATGAFKIAREGTFRVTVPKLTTPAP